MTTLSAPTSTRWDSIEALPGAHPIIETSVGNETTRRK
jgi:hypothetical protein